MSSAEADEMAATETRRILVPKQTVLRACLKAAPLGILGQALGRDAPAARVSIMGWLWLLLLHDWDRRRRPKSTRMSS